MSALDSKARSKLKRAFDQVVADEDVAEVVIRGHADARGTRRYNQRLSARRAESVSRYLKGNGLQAKKYLSRRTAKQNRRETTPRNREEHSIGVSSWSWFESRRQAARNSRRTALPTPHCPTRPRSKRGLLHQSLIFVTTWCGPPPPQSLKHFAG